MRRFTFLLTLVLFPGLLSADYRAIDVLKAGRLEGIVHFPGETPPPGMIANASDHDCPHGIAQNHLIVRQETLALQNALVIAHVNEGLRGQVGRIKLTTERCTLLPRVQTAWLGSSLELVNKDGAEHDIEAFVGPSSELRIRLRATGGTVRRPLVRPGFYKVVCNRHLWEKAWIYVSAGPYATVTDAQGRYAIEQIPPGRYTVRVWHEGWQTVRKDAAGRIDYRPVEQLQEVTIKTDKTATVDFEQLEGIYKPN